MAPVTLIPNILNVLEKNRFINIIVMVATIPPPTAKTNVGLNKLPKIKDPTKTRRITTTKAEPPPIKYRAKSVATWAKPGFNQGKGLGIIDSNKNKNDWLE